MRRKLHKVETVILDNQLIIMRALEAIISGGVNLKMEILMQLATHQGATSAVLEMDETW